MINTHKVSIANISSYDYAEIKAVCIKMFQDFGLPADNPLGYLIKPGNRVFIKPNWVASRWRKSCSHVDDLYCVITHPNIIEVIADFVAIALRGEGEIIIADNPSIDADFQELMQFTGIRRLENKYNVPCRILDLRPLVCDDLRNYGKRSLMVQQPGDPLGGESINLGSESLLYGIDPSKFRGVFDERDETINSHIGNTQLYTYSKTLYDSDVYISIPKLKTHHKVGTTLNLKGLVGSIIIKNQLVHWQVGYPATGGDEYPDYASYQKAQIARVTNRGAWPGNDTIWRMVVDLYLGLKKKERKYLSVVDGIIGGEGQGPFCPNKKESNTLIMGFDLLDVDIVATRYMGIDPKRIKYLVHFIQKDPLLMEAITVVHDGLEISGFFASDDSYLNFQVEDAWKEMLIRG